MSKQNKSINKKVDKLMDEKLSKLKGNLIEKENEVLDFKNNSFNILIGKQGASKTASVLRELLKLNYIEHNFHLCILVSNNSDDQTVSALIDSIDLPVVKSNYNEVESKLEDLFELKTEYNKMIEGTIPKDPEILYALRLNKFGKNRLQTIILLDDANYVLDKKSKSKFKKWLAQCRHLNIVVFCCLQNWGTIDASLKDCLSSTFIYRGFPIDRLRHIHRQINTGMDFKSFYELYNKLKPRQKIIVDQINSEVEIK